MRRVNFTLGFAVSALIGCAPSSGPDVGPEPGLHALPAAELDQYAADLRYITGLAKPGVRVRLNLADPRQYAFARARLKLAGKNASNSPYLFDLMEARRQKHVDGKLKVGTFAPESATLGLLEETSAERKEHHFIENANISSTQITGTASSTFPGSSWATGVDVNIATTSGYPIGPLGYAEEYDSPDVTIHASGNPSLSNVRRYSVSSYKWEDSETAGYTDSFVHTEVGFANPTQLGSSPELSATLVTAPVDVVGANGRISVCMDRAWTNDCDYILTGSAQSIKMPVGGQVSVLGNYKFDRQRIYDMRDALNNNLDPGMDVGSLKLVLRNAGGGCDVTDGNTLYARMAQFWNRVTLSTDDKTIYWDMTGANAAFFDDGCRMIQEDAKLTARIPFPLLSGATSYNASTTISNDPDVARPDYRLLPISITNSCLAEGTQIELGNGKLVAIESLRIGQDVANPYDRKDHALTITDTAKGAERSPMVRIRDGAGRTLLMTEMHPIATADRGMVQARSLKTGDVVMTTTGPSTLTEVSREAYTGQVYNLKLGDKTELASLGNDQTVVHANGFVVGDGQIQSKYEALSMKRESTPTVDQVPEQWRRDFLLSPHRE